MSRNRIIAIALIVLAFIGLYVVAEKRRTIKISKTTEQIQKDLGIPVRTAAIQLGRIEDTIPVTGSISALDTVTLSSKIQAKVVYVTVREGDPVHKGQVVIQLDRSDADSNLRQARAGLQAAQARLSQARTAASVTEVQSSTGIQQAKAALTAAEAQYEKIKKGARSQERMMAENAVATAKAGLDNAQANLKRMKQLFSQGAIAQAQLDVAQTQYDVAVAQYNSAKQNLSLVEEGARSEDIRAAETQVTQARAMLRAAEANADQNLLRQEDIKSAEAGVSQAEAMVTLAEEMLANTRIVSPIDGVISQRMTEPGQMATPSVPLMMVVSLQSVFFQADVSETVLAKIKPGQAVAVSVDTYPNTSFMGRISKIYPTGSTSTRSFSVRIQIPNPDSRLKPGMFGRGSIVTGGDGSAMLIPVDAVEERNGRNIVFTVEKGRAKMHTIDKRLSNSEFIEAVSANGLKPGDEVITSGHENLEDGSKVHLR